MGGDVRFGAGRDEFNARAKNPAQVACDDCLACANRHWADFVEGNLSRQEALSRIKEIAGHMDAAFQGPGALLRADESALQDVSAFLAVMRLRHGITQDDLDAAALPFRTATGRMTATPVFPRRFDA